MMRAHMPITALALASLTGLAACAEPKASDSAGFSPVYKGVETRLLDGDLVNFRVAMAGARSAQDVTRYARCAASQYTLIRGYGFARHVRTNVVEEGGIWTGDAVYTISAALPGGIKTLDAEIIAADCAENDIPMV
jgi:hypothetical protein